MESRDAHGPREFTCELPLLFHELSQNNYETNSHNILNVYMGDCMKIFNVECQEWLLKVGKLDHLKEICNGKLYMNESGYFRHLDNKYRGDVYDGRRPINMQKSGTPSLTFFNPNDLHQRVTIPAETVKNFTKGFYKDDKIPIFCCSKIDERILQKQSETKWILKQEFIDEMKQFGEYYLLLDKNELLHRLSEYAKNKNILIKENDVKYENIHSAYGMEILTETNSDPLQSFFIKDEHYRWQNEWRVCLTNKNCSLIGNKENYYEVLFNPLTFAIIGKVSDLYVQTLSIQTNNE